MYIVRIFILIVLASVYLIVACPDAFSTELDCRTFGYALGLKGIGEHKVYSLAQHHYARFHERFRDCVIEGYKDSKEYTDAEKAYQEKDYGTAFNLFLKNAQRGYMLSQLRTADLYFLGLGTARDFGEAFKWYKKAADRGSVKGLFKTGLAYKTGRGTEKNIDRAIDAFKKVVEKDPLSDNAWGNLALCYKQKGEYEHSLESINQSITINPANPDFRQIQAEVFLLSGDIENSSKAHEKALNLLIRNIDKQRSPVRYLHAAHSALFMANFKDSERYAWDGIALNSNAYELYSHLGHAYLLQHMKHEAIAMYREYMERIEGDLMTPYLNSLRKDFLLLKKRYPDDISLIEWAEEKLKLTDN
jgi:tetratricopeptide (TPR) repeat protein